MNTVWLVKVSSEDGRYEHAQVDSIWATKEDAESRVSRLKYSWSEECALNTLLLED